MSKEYKFFSGKKVLVQDDRNHIKEASKPKFTKEEVEDRIKKYQTKIDLHKNYVELIVRERELIREMIGEYLQDNKKDIKDLPYEFVKMMREEIELAQKEFMQKKVWYDHIKYMKDYVKSLRKNAI